MNILNVIAVVLPLVLLVWSTYFYGKYRGFSEGVEEATKVYIRNRFELK